MIDNVTPVPCGTRAAGRKASAQPTPHQRCDPMRSPAHHCDLGKLEMERNPSSLSCMLLAGRHLHSPHPTNGLTRYGRPLRTFHRSTERCSPECIWVARQFLAVMTTMLRPCNLPELPPRLITVGNRNLKPLGRLQCSSVVGTLYLLRGRTARELNPSPLPHQTGMCKTCALQRPSAPKAQWTKTYNLDGKVAQQVLTTKPGDQLFFKWEPFGTKV